MELKRLQLERKIIDAADGALTAEEIRQLKAELQDYPDLLSDFHDIMKQPDLSALYGSADEKSNFKNQISNIQQAINQYEFQNKSFEEVSLIWFRKYAIAASIAVLAVTSVFRIESVSEHQTDSEYLISEIFYPNLESEADDYMIYLEELSTQ